MGILDVWFLNCPDTPGKDVLHSLETWGHGASLEQVVRLVRLTRPEVILTWLPVYVAGENHDDHQAAGVLATEAFDLAGDPVAFPEQVEGPRDRTTISNYGEGLHPWLTLLTCVGSPLPSFGAPYCCQYAGPAIASHACQKSVVFA